MDLLEIPHLSPQKDREGTPLGVWWLGVQLPLRGLRAHPWSGRIHQPRAAGPVSTADEPVPCDRRRHRSQQAAHTRVVSACHNQRKAPVVTNHPAPPRKFFFNLKKERRFMSQLCSCPRERLACLVWFSSLRAASEL